MKGWQFLAIIFLFTSSPQKTKCVRPVAKHQHQRNSSIIALAYSLMFCHNLSTFRLRCEHFYQQFRSRLIVFHLFIYLGIFVVVVTLVIAGSVSCLEYDDICKTKHKGNSMRNPADCSRYFMCDGEKVKERRACWDDTLWDIESESCQPPDDVTCENVIIHIWLVLVPQIKSTNSILYSFPCRNLPSRMTRALVPQASFVIGIQVIRKDIFFARMGRIRATGEMFVLEALHFKINGKLTKCSCVFEIFKKKKTEISLYFDSSVRIQLFHWMSKKRQIFCSVWRASDVLLHLSERKARENQGHHR